MSNAPLQVTVGVVRETIEAAIKSLFTSDDLLLLQNDANERSISHRLAIHLETAISTKGEWGAGLHIDCEYNRDVANPHLPHSKKVKLPHRDDISNEDTEATTVFPDIIVHRRNSRVNLLVIEIKKGSGNTAADKFDREVKLPAYLKELGYCFGAFLVLGVGEKAGTIAELSVVERPSEHLVPIDPEYPIGN